MTSTRVTLREVARVAMRYWMIIALFAVTFGAGSAIYALTRKPLYESNSLLAPVKEEVGQLGALSGALGQIAGIAGSLNLGIGGASEDEAVAVLESRDFALRFMREHDVLPIMFPARWDPSRHDWKAKAGAASGTDAPSMDDAVVLFDRYRVVVIDRRTQFVRLSVRAPTAVLARDWASAMINELNAILRQRALQESQRAVAFLSKTIETDQLQSIRAAAAALLENQLRREVIAQSRQDYALRILDPPSLPDQRYYPKRTRMVLIGVSLGLLVGFFSVFGLRAWRRPASAPKA